jgi:uncharacterized paraquat-inducible protein A
MIDSSQFFVFYLSITLVPLILLWVWSQNRDRKLRAPLPSKWIYRCSECLSFYDSEEQALKLKCPRCGRQNELLRIN